VIMQAPQAYRLNPDTLNKINLHSQSGNLIPLSAVANMSTSVEPMDLNQFQKFNAVTLSGMMTPGHSLSEGLEFLKQKSQQLLPSSMTYDYVGESRHFLQEANRMLWTFTLAILVIFLVLAMQFESYRDPLIILFGSVPMALFAGLLFLKLGFGTLNIYTQIGLLTLIGLVSKHGILLTKFANELRHNLGLNKHEAISQAASLRLRPILMTTMAMVFGAIPLLIAHGAGSNSRFAIGVVITSGLVIGTLFTLFVVPVIYTLVAKRSCYSEQPLQSSRAQSRDLVSS
jgi:multidrug efflux pump